MYRVIFERHPKEGQKKEFIDAWKKGSDIIQTCPGAPKLPGKEERSRIGYDPLYLPVQQWKRTFKPKSIILETQLFDKTNKERNKEFNKAVEKLGKFFNLKVEVS